MTDLQRLARAAMELAGYNEEIAEVEAKLNELLDGRRAMERDIIPQLMAEAGLKSYQMSDGSRITLSTLAEGSLPKDPSMRAVAIDWLVANGYENLIENKVVSSWARGERAIAQAEYERLVALGNAKVTIDEGVNSKTLGARMRDRVVAGQPTPLDALGVAVFNVPASPKQRATNNDRQSSDDSKRNRRDERRRHRPA